MSINPFTRLRSLDRRLTCRRCGRWSRQTTNVCAKVSATCYDSCSPSRSRLRRVILASSQMPSARRSQMHRRPLGIKQELRRSGSAIAVQQDTSRICAEAGSSSKRQIQNCIQWAICMSLQIAASSASLFVLLCSRKDNSMPPFATT